MNYGRNNFIQPFFRDMKNDIFLFQIQTRNKTDYDNDAVLKKSAIIDFSNIFEEGYF